MATATAIPRTAPARAIRGGDGAAATAVVAVVWQRQLSRAAGRTVPVVALALTPVKRRKQRAGVGVQNTLAEALAGHCPNDFNGGGSPMPGCCSCCGLRVPTEPTRALPGSPDKIAVMMQRYGRGECHWHPGDVKIDSERYGYQVKIGGKGIHYHAGVVVETPQGPLHQEHDRALPSHLLGKMAQFLRWRQRQQAEGESEGEELLADRAAVAAEAQRRRERLSAAAAAAAAAATAASV